MFGLSVCPPFLAKQPVSSLFMLNALIPFVFYHLISGFCSTLQDGFELPSRLGVSAADCFLALTETLTKIAEAQRSKLKSEASQPITLIPSASDKKMKLASKPLSASNTRRDYILWHHLDVMICLVQRLLAVSHLFFSHLTSMFYLCHFLGYS